MAASGEKRMTAIGRSSSGAAARLRERGRQSRARHRGRGHDQSSRRPEADRDLPVERVGCGQQAVALAVERDCARHGKIGNPGLAVVRIGREDRIGQGAQPRILALARLLPGLAGGGRITGERPEGGASGDKQSAAERVRKVRREGMIGLRFGLNVKLYSSTLNHMSRPLPGEQSRAAGPAGSTDTIWPMATASSQADSAVASWKSSGPPRASAMPGR